jgi:hypothetical protein
MTTRRLARSQASRPCPARRASRRGRTVGSPRLTARGRGGAGREGRCAGPRSGEEQAPAEGGQASAQQPFTAAARQSAPKSGRRGR